MKTIEQITLYKGGEPAYEPITVRTAEGKEETKHNILTTTYLIKTMIDNYQFKNRGQQRNADKLWEKINQIEEADLKTFELEDAEYALVGEMLQDFAPYLNGRLWAPLHTMFEPKP
jgi:hypothetical protein